MAFFKIIPSRCDVVCGVDCGRAVGEVSGADGRRRAASVASDDVVAVIHIRRSASLRESRNSSALLPAEIGYIAPIPMSDAMPTLPSGLVQAPTSA